MRDPQECPNWDGNAEGCDCPWCITEAMEAEAGIDDEDEDECPHCDFGCSACSPFVPRGPNGCTCGFNGDCNCPLVETRAPLPTLSPARGDS